MAESDAIPVTEAQKIVLIAMFPYHRLNARTFKVGDLAVDFEMLYSLKTAEYIRQLDTFTYVLSDEGRHIAVEEMWRNRKFDF